MTMPWEPEPEPVGEAQEVHPKQTGGWQPAGSDQGPSLESLMGVDHYEDPGGGNADPYRHPNHESRPGASYD